MNQKEWKYLRANNKELLNFTHYNNARKIQKSLQYNNDPNAVVIHHLRDTEEQRKYNDEHYELWGFEIDENGNEHFEYGKYVIFVTKEDHAKIHKCSEETRKKLSIAHSGSKNYFYGKHHSDASKIKMSLSQKNRFKHKVHPMYGKHHTDASRLAMSTAHLGKMLSEEHKHNISNGIKATMTDERRHQISEQSKLLWQDDDYRANQIARLTGENNPFYGKHHTEEAKEKNRQAHLGENNSRYGIHLSEETKKKISDANKISLLGKHHTEETKKKMSDSQLGHVVSNDTKSKLSKDKQVKSTAFTSYKLSGGTLSWNEFQKAIKNGIIDMYIYLKDI
jgi:hypothetical protein